MMQIVRLGMSSQHEKWLWVLSGQVRGAARWKGIMRRARQLRSHLSYGIMKLSSDEFKNAMTCSSRRWLEDLLNVVV